MGWKDTNSAYVDIPQGCKIFYPADYVLFIDSLGQRTDIEWDALEVVSQTELQASETQRDTIDTQLKNAIGGTLRHCLAIQEAGVDFDDTDFVDLGGLSWNYNSTSQFFLVSFNAKKPNTDNDIANIICSKYTSIARNSLQDKQVCYNTSGYLIIKDTAYTDATAFKNAMKGVLLAYEKA